MYMRPARSYMAICGMRRLLLASMEGFDAPVLMEAMQSGEKRVLIRLQDINPNLCKDTSQVVSHIVFL